MSKSLDAVLVRDVIVESKTPMAKATTLEAHHQQKMREFTDQRASVGELKAELAAAEERLGLPFGSTAEQSLRFAAAAARHSAPRALSPAR
jgi:hypothetical protein